MAAFAHVAPPEALIKLWGSYDIDPYFLLLAHDVVERSAPYKSFVGVAEAPWIILDNSLVELGHPASAEMMQEACDIIQPNLVTLPDYLGDLRATIEASEYALHTWSIPQETSYLAVLQGQTYSELEQCLNHYLQYPQITWIAIPRVLTAIFGTRMHAIQLAKHFGYNYLHLFGFSDDLRDDFLCAHIYPQVKGIDSAVPLRVAVTHNIDLQDLIDGVVRQPPRGDYWEQVQSEAWTPSEMCAHNIYTARRLSLYKGSE